MYVLNALTLEFACTLANTIGAKALFVSADVIQEFPIPSGMLKDTDVILFTNHDSPTEPSAEVTAVLRLPSLPLPRIAQIKLAVVIGLAEGYIQGHDKIVCLAGKPAFGFLDCLMVLDIGKEDELLSAFSVPETGQLLSSVVFEILLKLAVELANQGREGKPVGATFVLGDHDKVLQLSRQIIFNPFAGYPEEERSLLAPHLWDTLKGFSALDGAFVIREDGVIVSCGRHLNAALSAQVQLPSGFGSRHISAAGITSITDALAIVISESTGDVRIFKDGTIFMEIEKPLS